LRACWQGAFYLPVRPFGGRSYPFSSQTKLLYLKKFGFFLRMAKETSPPGRAERWKSPISFFFFPPTEFSSFWDLRRSLLMVPFHREEVIRFRVSVSPSEMGNPSVPIFVLKRNFTFSSFASSFFSPGKNPPFPCPRQCPPTD